mgnify:CR=1 FL=1
MQYHLAVDIGASSGRHLLGWVEEGTMKVEEIYRFSNGLEKRQGHLCWNIDYLLREIICGLKRCREIGRIPSSMSIDTWGVDYVLLDEDDKIIADTYGYRDDRTNGMDDKVYQYITKEELYERTGIQKQPFNTIYQLMAMKEQMPEEFSLAESMLLIPDYLNFCLTGVKMTEYTNATTTQLVNACTKDWDYEVIRRLGFSRKIFGKIHMPGTLVGELREELQKEVGFTLQILQCASHDTGSAVLAIPAIEEPFAYISSGTWSLMGTEQRVANCSLRSEQLNLTNEGGYEYRFRYPKNIMGLWMIQSINREFDNQYTFSDLCAMAESSKMKSVVDCNDQRFLAPASMVEAVKQSCRETGQPVPHEVKDLAAVIYRSLAKCYAETLQELEACLETTFEAVHIIGGGAKAEYLNQLTADTTGKVIFAGPYEATAIGNLTAQMITFGELGSVEEARRCIRDSFKIKKYSPMI